MHLSDAYIGRLFLQLKAYIAMPCHQAIPQIMFHIFELAGTKLRDTYGLWFLKQAKVVQQKWIPAYNLYI